MRTQKDGLTEQLLRHFLPPPQLFPPRPLLSLPSSSLDQSGTRLLRSMTTTPASLGGSLLTISSRPPSPLPFGGRIGARWKNMELEATNIQRFDDLQRVGHADRGSPAWELRLQGPVGRSVHRSKRRILDGQLAGGLLPTGQSVGKLHSLYNLAIWLDL